MVHAFNPTVYVNTNGGRSRRISKFKSSLVDRPSSRITEYTQRKNFYFKKRRGRRKEERGGRGRRGEERAGPWNGFGFHHFPHESG